VFHVTGITAALSNSALETIDSAMDIARDNGVLVSFDPNMRRNLWSSQDARPVMERLMAKADLVMPGADDVEGILDRPFEASDTVEWLRSIGCERIIMKVGESGAIVLDDGDLVEVPTKKSLSPVDLAGAGDAFAAGLLAGILQGLDDVQAAAFANKVAGFAIALPGNIESMPSRQELEQERTGARDIMR
jgi:2-dehydro-3-deoxygluconokinase